jgi:TatD DNase family protein
MTVIIDSHAHYAHPGYEQEFPYLTLEDGRYAIARGDRDELFARMREAGIVGFIEPSIELERIDAQLALAAAHPDCLGVALGVHPTRCVRVPLRKCRLLRQYAEQNHPLAIGETGLDYHLDREEQHRLRQRFWFTYQLRLADRLRLPLVLHVRDADDDALRILRRNRKRIHGGVVHCFTGTPEHAMAYRELGLHIGIGGKLLWDNEESARLCEAIRRLPLEAILVETDAPLVLPDIGKPDCSRSQRRRLRNSSLILPAVIERIASLHGVSPETVEQTVCRNTLRLFRIEIEQGGNCHVQN